MSTQTLVGRITQRRGVRQFVKFGIVGASGFVVNFALFTLLQNHTPADQQASHLYVNNSIGFLAGAISNYALNRIWTFRSSRHALLQGMQFVAVSFFALVVDNGAIKLLEPHLGPGHRTWFLGLMAAMIVNFFVNKYWTFREPA